ncbi:MAG: outer membrane beta-barrel protein [Bacteroidia bacterium]
MKTLKIKATTLLLSAGVLFVAYNSKAQTGAVAIDASQVVSNFKFTDSEGTQQKEYSPRFTSAYSLGYRHKLDNGVIIRGALGMRNAGATLIYDESNYSWNLQYMDIKVGAGYAYSLSKLDVYLTVSPYYAFLLKANQRINNEDYDIKTSAAINKADYGVIFSPGVILNVNDFMSAYVEINYLMGLANLETGETGQKSNNTAIMPTLGVAFKLK